MPYIERKARTALKKRAPISTGELNYVITKCILRYLSTFPRLSYDTFNWVIGVIDIIKYDIDRRMWHGYPHGSGLKRNIAKLIIAYLGPDHMDKYGNVIINEHYLTQIRGVLSCVQLELYRRSIVPYEELKRKSNGEVYD